MKTIEIIVSPKGDTRVETKGFVGAECREASKLLEDALGKREHEQLTSAFHASQQAAQRAHQSS